MNDFKRRIIEFWQDKKKRKTAIIIGIVIATLIATITTISITSVNSSSSSQTDDDTVSRSLIAQSELPSNTTDLNQMGNATIQANQTSPSSDSNAVGSIGNESWNEIGESGFSAPGEGASSAHNPSVSKEVSLSRTPISVTCTIAIDCSSISGNGALTAAGKPWLEPYAANPGILPAVSIQITDTNGDGRVGVDEAIKQACNNYGIQYEFKSSSYLKGMNYLYEFDAGPNSGWMYKVNGRIPNQGCNSYYLNGGEDILWYYVISY